MGETLEIEHFEQARNKTLEWFESNGFKAEKPTIGKFGTNAGKNVGMQTTDGKTGYRIEYDERSGAHINVWSGKNLPHITSSTQVISSIKTTQGI